MTDEDPYPFTPGDFARQDESDDSLFYQEPRLLVHIDEQAIAAIGELFREVIPPDSVILDLMSSWRSHWPSSLRGHSSGRLNHQTSPVSSPHTSHPKARMVGLGLNAVEMQDNPDLDDYLVHDVNQNPRLPFDDCTFDAVVITVSIQYLTSPIQVFRDVNRVLKLGGLFLVIFSNRMFFTKAVRVWTMANDEQRMQLVGAYFHYAGNYEEIKGMSPNSQRGAYEDPVYLVMARKCSAAQS